VQKRKTFFGYETLSPTPTSTFKLQMTRANFAKTRPEFKDYLQAWKPYLGKMLLKRSSPFKYDANGEYTRMPGKREKEDIRQLWGQIGTCLCPKMRKLRKKYMKEQRKLQNRWAKRSLDSITGQTRKQPIPSVKKGCVGR
jgi:hypothetical protein